MPIQRACVLDSDSKTVGIKVTGTDRKIPDVHVVSKEDENSGKYKAFWRDGPTNSDPWLFMETCDVRSGDCHGGELVWVSGHSVPVMDLRLMRLMVGCDCERVLSSSTSH